MVYSCICLVFIIRTVSYTVSNESLQKLLTTQLNLLPVLKSLLQGTKYGKALLMEVHVTSVLNV